MIDAWHFVGATLRDGRPIPADGKWLVHTGPVEICSTGLHASRRPWHALRYAPGETLCRVECDDVVTEQDDKLVCRRRRIVERADVTEAMRYFARMQALSVIHLHPEPPDVVLDYLMTGDESIRAAAGAFAGDAAGAAARVAARAAARDVRDAARATAWAVAWAVAWAPATCAWATAGREFDSLIYEQFGVQR
jgi:hypothetical protein